MNTADKIAYIAEHCLEFELKYNHHKDWGESVVDYVHGAIRWTPQSEMDLMTKTDTIWHLYYYFHGLCQDLYASELHKVLDQAVDLISKGEHVKEVL